MRAPFSHLTILTAAVTLIAATPAPTAGSLTLREGSRLWFEGTSTVTAP